MIKISLKQNLDKLKVEVYVPLNTCFCEWDKFINRVFIEITPYIKYIEHETKNLHSPEARSLNLRNKCVVIDGGKKIFSPVLLKKELPKLLKTKGLI